MLFLSLCFQIKLWPKLYLFSFVETPRKFIIAELSIRILGSSSVLIIIPQSYKQVYCIHHANVQGTYYGLNCLTLYTIGLHCQIHSPGAR